LASSILACASAGDSPRVAPKMPPMGLIPSGAPAGPLIAAFTSIGGARRSRSCQYD
jgi:hypothetical protein